MLRDLLRRLARPARRDDRRAVADEPLWAVVGQASRPDSELLAQIERVALDVYADHGLPTRPGHYRWSPRARTWTFLGEHLSPEARWALLLERAPDSGWRYGTLSDLGRSGVPELLAAASVLDSCARLREGSPGREDAGPWDTMELAIRLGAQWQALEHRRIKSKPRLRLAAPEAEPPRADGKPPAHRRQRPRKPGA